MSFFSDIGDFLGDIAPAAAGAATSLIPGVGPALAPVAAGLTNSLINGGGSSGGGGSPQMAGGINTGSYDAISQQQSELLDKLLGYETAGSKFLEDYTLNVFMDAEDDYNDSKRSRNTFDNVMDAVQSETLDPFSAQQFLSSRFMPNSEFYGSDDYAKLLDAEVGDKKQNLLVNDAFATNYYRDPTALESRYYKNLAGSMGMNKSPAQFSSFLNTRLANSLEGAAKGPLNSFEQAASAYYGNMVRLPDGTKTGTYNVYGKKQYPMSASKTLKKDFYETA